MKRRSETVRDTTLELENLRLRQENTQLHSIVTDNMEALKESSALLLKSKPPRPHISSEKKLLAGSLDEALRDRPLAALAGSRSDRSKPHSWRESEGHMLTIVVGVDLLV